MTSVTTLLALFALFSFGGSHPRFTIALIWGVFVGTYSSIALAVPLLIYFKIDRRSLSNDDEDEGRNGGIDVWISPRWFQKTVSSFRAMAPVVSRSHGSSIQGSIIVLPGRTLSWHIAKHGDINIKNLVAVLEEVPRIEILLIGCGQMMQLLPRELTDACRREGLAVDAMDTGAACRAYNILAAEGRRVAAGLVRSRLNR